MTHHETKPELLAPAGNWDCARAAVENGADAIYFGLDVGFNARARAANFHLADLPKLITMLHRQGVRGYVTLNTLVFTDELPSLEENVRHLAGAGVDAVLVQDLGVARLVREVCPDLEIHASTQMTLTHAAGIELISELGIRRVVLAREMAIAEIRRIHELTEMPLEAFVHGALCVAYSGQCLTSESLGGRSANRGQCAQACRLPYDLFCDGEHQDLGDVRYLLSPQDLAAHELIPSMLDAGVCSFKVEGRLKTPEYVANVCRNYREILDAAIEQRHRVLDKDEQRDLELSFSRGFSPGWLEGCDHKRLVPGLSSAKRGVLVGSVASCGRDSVIVDLSAPLATGDGVVFEGDRFAGQEIGGRVYQLVQGGQSVSRVEEGHAEVAFAKGTFEENAFATGTHLWKTDDPQLTKRLRKTFQGPDPAKRVPVDVSIQVAAGEPIRVSAVWRGRTVSWQNDFTPEVANKHPVSPEKIRQQLERLGGTVYRLGELDAHIAGEPMVPHSVLGEIRKELVERLDALPAIDALACSHEAVLPKMLPKVSQRTSSEPASLRVLCRSLAQVEQVLEAGCADLIADLHDVREYKQASAMARGAGATIELATLRIHKPGEDGLFRAMHKVASDGWLVRNLPAVAYCRKHAIPFRCDFSLNVTNPLTAEQLLGWGAQTITASYDLNRDQLLELAAQMPTEWLEVVIHQHMPMFHMEHCVFCSVLSPGKNKSDCGRPCDRHEVELGDRVGVKHVLHADIGCRNTLYNGNAQSGAEAVGPLQDLGVRTFRVELLRDASVSWVQKIVHLYAGLLQGQLAAAEVWRELKADNRVGVTRGTLEQPRNPLAIL